MCIRDRVAGFVPVRVVGGGGEGGRRAAGVGVVGEGEVGEFLVVRGDDGRCDRLRCGFSGLRVRGKDLVAHLDFLDGPARPVGHLDATTGGEAVPLDAPRSVCGAAGACVRSSAARLAVGLGSVGLGLRARAVGGLLGRRFLVGCLSRLGCCCGRFIVGLLGLGEGAQGCGGLVLCRVDGVVGLVQFFVDLEGLDAYLDGLGDLAPRDRVERRVDAGHDVALGEAVAGVVVADEIHDQVDHGVLQLIAALLGLGDAVVRLIQRGLRGLRT